MRFAICYAVSMNGPRRIVSLLSSATEILYLMGLGDRVVGVSHECDYPDNVRLKPQVTRSNVDSTAGSRAIDDQGKSLLATGGPLYEIDVATLVALEPDLIVTQAQCDACAVRYEDVLAAINDQPVLRGVPIVALNPRSLTDVLEDIERVAIAADVCETGKRIIAELVNRIDAVRRKSLSADRPRVACIEWTDPLMLAANWMPELVQLAGGVHGLTQAKVQSGYSTWDDLIGYNPQVIVVMPCGFDLDRSVAEAIALALRPGWLQLDAVKTGRVFAVDANSYFNRSGPRLVESLELLAHFIHPKAFDSPATVDANRTFQVMRNEVGKML